MENEHKLNHMHQEFKISKKKRQKDEFNGTAKGSLCSLCNIFDEIKMIRGHAILYKKEVFY